MTTMALSGRRTGRVIRTRGERGSEVPGLSTLGMTIFLVSLSILFVGSMVAFLVIRLNASQWPPAGAPPIPRLLWVSTLLLLGCSGTIHAALVAIRRGDQRKLMRWLSATCGLALAFLGCQSAAWLSFFDAPTFQTHLYGFTFYVLTGLHALHVLGGVVALAAVMFLTLRGSYSWAHYPGVRNAALYWHFLDGVWLVLFGFLILTR
jgi:heme/copper-type cytochrome/quinol oxidase subunit 3